MRDFWEDVLYKLRGLKTSMTVFVEFLQRLVAWIPVLWHDVDWDYGGLVKIMSFKMRRMADCIEDNSYKEGCHRTAKQLRYAAFLCDAMLDGKKLPKIASADQAFDDKWGKYVKPSPELATLRNSLFGLYRENIKTEEDGRAYIEDLFNLATLCNEVEEDAKERLFKHLNKYIRHFWD